MDTVGATTMHAGVTNSVDVAIEAAVADRRPADVPYRPAAEPTNIRLLGQPPCIASCC